MESMSSSICVSSVIAFVRCLAQDGSLEGTKTRRKLISDKGIVRTTPNQAPISLGVASYGAWTGTMNIFVFAFGADTSALHAPAFHRGALSVHDGEPAAM